ncbi:MAG: GDP-mannose 4,6-dehydratase [Acidobacteria bacterium]|nr:GDP-mannose 4,6-dehydratase [Acidobacteriota bacterium]
MPQATVVTGGTGFAGRHLLDLIGSSSDVIAWYRPGGRLPDRGGVTWRPVDVVDRAAVADAIREAQPARLFHLAGAPNVATSWQNVLAHLQTNALGTHHLLDAVRRYRPGCRVLVVSSAHIYQPGDSPIDEHARVRPESPYGFSKLAQDQLALQAATEEGLDVVVARPFNHIGPRQQPGFAIADFARQIARIERGLTEPVLRVGNLTAKRDVSDVRDVVRAYATIVSRGTAGRPYNVCSGRASRMQDLLERLIALSSASIRVETDPARLRPHDAPIIQGDPTRIQSELDWTPSIPIDQTLRDTLEGWRADVASSSR